MDCPRCRLPLRNQEYEGVMVDLCANCWGLWLDRGEFEVILDLQRLHFSEDERKQLLDARHHGRHGPRDPIPCPSCGVTMNQKHYDTSVDLCIDECEKHGLWLDAGEIKVAQAISEQSAGVHRMLLAKLGLGQGSSSNTQ